MGQRSQTETLAGIYQAFLQRRTWKQKDLAKALEIGVEALRKILFELRQNGMPLDREEDHPHVYWSVPKDWYPSSVLFKREEVPELLRQLRRVPHGQGRARLLELVLRRLPTGASASAGAVVARESSAQEDQYLGVVEDAANRRVVLGMRYFTASRGAAGDRHVSVHRVLVGPPARFVGTCHRTDSVKTFRVDSIMSARLDDSESYRATDDAIVDDFCKASLDGFHNGGAPTPFAFFVRDPEARWVKNNLLDGMTSEDLPDGIRIVTNTTALGRLARFVVGLGAAAVPETPALAEEVKALARGALASITVASREHAAPAAKSAPRRG